MRRKLLYYLLIIKLFKVGTLWAAPPEVEPGSQPSTQLASQPSAQFEELCPGVWIDQKINPGLSDLEESLVCGVKKDAKHYSTEAWRTIPFHQLKFHLRTFLQDRGYHEPEIKKEEGRVWVKPGKKQILTRIHLVGAPAFLKMERKRKVIGENLTPKLLETLEKWIQDELHANGHPCAQVKTHADTRTGEVTVEIDPGPVQNVIEVTEDATSVIDPEVFSRYRAFDLHQPFRGHLLSVTENRIQSTGIVEANHFSVRCRPDGAVLHHSSVLGPPRFLSFGAGVNTEGIVRGKATWKNVRVGRMASLIDFSAVGSARLQTLWLRGNFYLGPASSRLALSPLIQVTHENFEQKETLSGREQVGLSTNFDEDGFNHQLFSGPTLDQYRTYRGAGVPYFNYLSLETRWMMKSHEFEYYASNPRTGLNLALTTNLSRMQKLFFRGEALWNYKDYDPALWIFAVRGGFSSLLTSGAPSSDSDLPGDFFQYLGGSADVRGFGLQELPREGSPRALTATFVGLEARLSNTLPYGVDPFAFVDFGMLGNTSLSLNSTVYASPGFGVRWASPIGVIRSTLARGFSGNPQDHWQFYFNYGEEF